MFQQYVAPSVVSELLANPELLDLGGEEREATVLFCDVAGFTNISEGLSPTDLVKLLNDYLTEMTEIVFQFNGIIDKYEGDAMMAEFGVPVPHPDHALQSCLAAIEMQRRLIDMRVVWKEEGRSELHSRIGINTGSMLVGNLGSNHVMDYTVMGDNVNLASRLEGVNKVYGTNICISESTYDQLQGELICRELDLIRVKGKQQPVRIFEVLETVDHGIPGGRYSMLERYEMALMFYRDQRFEDALELFTELHEVDPDDGPTKVGKMRCETYVKNPPPPEWDGVFTMTTK
jgi:adenylate cyclase